MSAQDLTSFLAWAEENEIVWDKNAIEVREGKHGLGVYAKKAIEAETQVIQVPKAVVLSVESTGIANLIEESELEGYVGLALAAMYELSKGSESLWASYLALLNNRRPQMAGDLSAEAREIMKKSEVYGDIETDLKDMREDYDTLVAPFLEKHPEIFTEEVKGKFFSFEDFKVMTAHVSSRSMDVDDYHGLAFVPFADFVNHNANANADYLTREDVCEVCGAITCEHMEDDDEDEEDEAPELSADKKSSKKAETSGESAEDEDEDDEDWIDESSDTCDITLDEDVKKGDEITRHYGPFPNKIFLSKYGFAEIDNDHDTVTIQLDMIKKVAESTIGDSAIVEERVKWFLDTEDVFIGEDDDDELEGGCCGGDHDHDHAHDHDHDHKEIKKKEESEAAQGEEEEDVEEDDDFPRDIMYMMRDGSIDDRMLMLLNILYMEKEQFSKIQESIKDATDYFNDIFLRRAIEEGLDDDDEEAYEERPELKPLDETGRKVRKAVLEATLQVIRHRADAFGVTDATTAEEDLEVLKKSDQTGPLYYGTVCVQGEKQIIQNGLKTYTKFLAEL
ncbi:hypothetical protein BGZ76_005271 [Entomortierella beljakovae]|nr:hypothetical protein BGZ76_005271 [Entomortierella beljakovae]